jgi:protein tyrosine/serine phosphatase
MTLQTRYFSFLLIVALFFGGLVFGQTKSAVTDKDLPNFSQVNENLYRGGQPTEVGVKKLEEDFKIKTIINLRGADERAKKEENWAKDADIKFINVPLQNWFGPKDEKIEKILNLINDPENQPVFIHCKRGSDRTGTAVAVYRMTHDGWTAKQAHKEAKKFKIGWWQFWMKDYINDYYRDFIANK